MACIHDPFPRSPHPSRTQARSAQEEAARLEAQLQAAERARLAAPPPMDSSEEVEQLKRLNARLLGDVAGYRRRLKEAGLEEQN